MFATPITAPQIIHVIGFKCSSVPVFSMPLSPIRSWGALYDYLGYPEPEDPELTCAVIITTFTAPHQNPVIALNKFYVSIRLHSHLSVVPVHHFG